jgi:DMSO/TMAO reductase YedYZ molybdopterin-dependent catalytic subunit
MTANNSSVAKRGIDLVRDLQLNRSTTFTEEDRKKLGLNGPAPDRMESEATRNSLHTLSRIHAPGDTLDRRAWLHWAGVAGLAGLLPVGCARRTHVASPDEGTLIRFPQKVALRALNDRAPMLETPWEYFRHDLTPNEAFYVRWHLEAVPTHVELRTWRLRVDGHVARPLELSMEDIRRMEAVSLVAVNQCSGNSRSLFAPRVPGGQWGNGAMGNARWTGVRLGDLLRRAGLRAGAVQVSFDGLDEGPLPSVPDFVKALDVDHARQPEVLVAYEMNGTPLPMLNGFPARLVVPGWYATYWVKALTHINVLDSHFTGFWMTSHYRIPGTPGANELPEAPAHQTVPINRLNVRSFFVRPDPGAWVLAGQAWALEGIAFDGGHGIRQVEVSADGGGSWSAARLGEDLGRFSFRRWHAEWTPLARGEYRLQVRAVNNAGEGQPVQANWNRGGFMRNVIEEIQVTAV